MLALVIALLVLATRVAAGHPHTSDRDEPALDDTLDLDRDLALDTDDEPAELHTLDGALLDRVDLLDLVDRGDLDRLPLVEPAPLRPSWLGRIDVGIAWRRRIDTGARALAALPTAVDQLWLFATWSR